MRKAFITLLLQAGAATAAFAQDKDLMAELNNDKPAGKKEVVTSTFKATRIVNTSTVQNLHAGVLDFRILHRFGRVSDGIENFYGIDNATTRIGLDYGVTNWLMVGIAHNTLRKANDGFIKARLLQQKKDGTPIALTYFGGMVVYGDKAPPLPPGMEFYFTHHLAYTNQLLIARKFNSKLSLQLMPTVVHHNLVDSTKFSNTSYAIGVGGRYKVSNRVAVTGEYFFRANNVDMPAAGAKTYNSLSIGADIETGGHVFQLFFTNTLGMTEPMVMTQTTDTWTKGQLHFGFNISRVFTVVKPKEFKKGGADKW